MKRFILFGGTEYYRRGGLDDCLVVSDSLDNITAAIASLKDGDGHGDCPWYQVLDTHTGIVTMDSEYPPYELESLEEYK